MKHTGQTFANVYKTIQAGNNSGNLCSDAINVHRQDDVQLNATPCVLVWNAEFFNAFNKITEQIESSLELLTGPLTWVVQCELRRRRSCRTQPNKLSDYLIRRHSTRLNRRVNNLKVSVKAHAARVQSLTMLLDVIDMGLPQPQSTLQILQHRTLLGLIAVQFQAHAIQADVRESSPHDVQSSHFLGHEEN